MNVAAIVSGGLDSVTMAYHLAQEERVAVGAVVSFDYGQRHVKELSYAAECARQLDAEHIVLSLQPILGGLRSALTSDAVEVPDGHYAEETMSATIVPGRNLLMIAAATAVAVDRRLDAVALGVHAGDHFIYPDCRPRFVDGARLALREGYAVSLLAPFVERDKTWIARRAHELGVPVDDTWSCYKGSDIHCGACGTCQERREAFVQAGVPDPTEYAYTGPLAPAPS